MFVGDFVWCGFGVVFVCVVLGLLCVVGCGVGIFCFGG